MISKTSSARPQLTIDELQQLKWLLGGVLTVLAVGTVAYMDINAWGLMPLTIAVSMATTFWPTLPARVPRLVQVLAFPVIAAFFAIDLWLRSELLPATIRLDMLLLLYRGIVYRQRRDDLQVIVLGLFLVVVAGVVTVSLAFAVQILGYTTCALLFLLTITLGEAAAGSRLDARGTAAAISTAPLSPETPAARLAPPSWAVHVNWRRLLNRVAAVARWRVLALGSGLFVGLIAVTALLFLVIPRFQLDNGMFLDRFMTRQARTGFTDSIRFGDVTEILEDTSVALHVDVAEPGQIPATPYWRMLVLNQYEDGTFRMSADLRRARFGNPRTGRWAQPPRPPPRSASAVWTFYLEPGVSRYLPLLNAFGWLRFSESQNFRGAYLMALMALNKDPVTVTAYQVGGFELATRLSDPPGNFYSALIEAKAPGAAQDNAILRRLAHEAIGDQKVDTATLAARLCGWLRDRHAYSLSPRIPAGPGDPLVRWTNSNERGHCELFAGAFVLLARAAGYPARMVTGFRGGTWNGFISSSFMVRNSDAHAWAEIYDPVTTSWLRADPLEIPAATQAAAVGEANLGRMDRSWSARLDSLRVFWYRRVVNFDEQAQVHTFQLVKEATQATTHRLRERLLGLVTRVEAWFRTPWDAGRIASVITLTGAAAVLMWAGRWLRLAVLQHLFFWRRPARREDPIRREAGRWLRRVAEADSPERERVIPDLQRLRFGARETWPEAAVVFRRARRVLRGRTDRRRRDAARLDEPSGN